MELADVFVPLTIGILGVGYPVLLQVIARLDEQYHSVVIGELFLEEPALKGFKVTLYIAVAAVILWGLKIPLLKMDCDCFSALLLGFAPVAATVATIVLVVFFFALIDKLLVYNTTIRMTRYLMKKHDAAVQKNDFRFFKALGDILHISIKRNNEDVARAVSDYCYTAFRLLREQQEGTPVEYPADYYQFAYKTTIEVLAKPDIRWHYLAARSAGGIWLLGELSDTEISEKTYSWLWQIMRRTIENGADDYVMDLWEHADQHASQHLGPIANVIDNNTFELLNQAEIKKRENDRKRFEEFFIALGGLILYRSRFDCIRRMFRHTRSLPPSYELLPASVTEVFYWYDRFIDRHDRYVPWLSIKYSFPGLSGSNSDGLIKGAIFRYLALLFLRLYSITPRYVYEAPLRPPVLPETQGERSQRLEKLPYLTRLVLELHNDKALLAAVGLGFLSDAWCAENNKPTPEVLLGQIRTMLENGIERGLNEQEPATDKVQEFMTATGEILTPELEKLKNLSGSVDPGPGGQKLYVEGRREIMDKSSFVHGQGVHHINFESICAEMVAMHIRLSTSEILWRCNTRQYAVKEEDIRETLNRLHLRDDNYLIISFGFDAGAAAREQGWASTNTRFLFLQDQISPITGYCFFVLREADMPVISLLPPSTQDRARYALEPVSEEVNLYASVIDLNRSAELREASAAPDQNRDLRKSVLVCISVLIEWQIKRGFPCIYVQTIFPYSQDGLSNNMNEIIRFE